MWMQNTYVSLDMVFIRRGRHASTRIAENTEPLSTRIVSSGGPARYVVRARRRSAASHRSETRRPGHPSARRRVRAP